jgi:acyl-coenzyme A thioesterase PaaI-like protein
MHYDAENKQMVGNVICTQAYEGPENMVHGAVIAGIYDQLLALVSSSHEQPSFTAYLKVDYKKPTPLYQPLEFRAWTDRIEGRKMFIHGQCTYRNEVVTECEGLFIQLKS